MFDISKNQQNVRKHNSLPIHALNDHEKNKNLKTGPWSKASDRIPLYKIFLFFLVIFSFLRGTSQGKIFLTKKTTTKNSARVWKLFCDLLSSTHLKSPSLKPWLAATWQIVKYWQHGQWLSWNCSTEAKRCDAFSLQHFKQSNLTHPIKNAFKAFFEKFEKKPNYILIKCILKFRTWHCVIESRNKRQNVESRWIWKD